MSRVGIGNNIFQPNKQCLSCKRWKPAQASSIFCVGIPGRCSLGYCEKNRKQKK